MCGIVALLRLGERPLPGPETLTRMLASIAHRGPDDWGTTSDDDVQLGAVRLAVIDPHGGRQPVRGCASARVSCVYNGELYDAADHRRALERSHPLADGCDTTLLPHLYEEHGAAMVERMRGMFAFALWDGSARRLLLARDRLGLKPLFWARTPDYLVVASEVKAILVSGLVERAIDRDALDDVFSLSYPCPPRTMFRGVHELRPAHRMLAAPGRVGEPERWWRAPFVPRGEHRPGRARDHARRLREALGEAVRTHLVSDVPLAARVSGGIDSSAIAALAREVTGAPPATFSIGFEDPRYDESPYARAVARHLGSPMHTVMAGAHAAERLTELVWHTEMPPVVPGAIGGLLLAERERREGVPVVLTGDGADELLGGYDVFRAARARRFFDRPGLRPWRRWALRAAGRMTHQPRGLVDWLLETARPSGAVAAAFDGVVPPWLDAWRLLDVERVALLSVDGAHRVRPVEEAPAGFAALVHPDVASLDPLDAELALELETRLPSWILVISDRTAMAHGVEARVPFLDHPVVALTASLPPAVKMRGLREKAVLRDAVRDLLPRSVVNRTKQPFLMPIHDWFFGERAPDALAQALSPDAVRDAGLFAPDVVARLREALRRSPERHVIRLRLEMVLMLVLGSQLLHRLFIADAREALASWPERSRFRLRRAGDPPAIC
ncbi:MAG: asparagine synthase (glutamine-hydrolyzing) [Polyangiaceae bacterium]